MPHLNSRGDVAHGVGGGYASLNNVHFSRGAVFGWIDDDTIVFANGDDAWIVSTYHVPARTITRLGTTGANSGFAGGGHAAWWLGAADGTRGLSSTTGLRLPDAGLMGMGPDGAICYKPDYQSNGPTRVRELDGTDWLLTEGHADYVSLQGQGRALWMEGLQAHARGLPEPRAAAGPIWKADAIWCAGAWWICYYSAARGIVLHPFDALVGYSHMPMGDGWHTARAISDRVIRVATATGQGEQAGEIWVRDYDVVANTVHDPWDTNAHVFPAVRVDIESINAQSVLPVDYGPPLERPIWYGWYKVLNTATDGSQGSCYHAERVGLVRLSDGALIARPADGEGLLWTTPSGETWLGAQAYLAAPGPATVAETRALLRSTIDALVAEWGGRPGVLVPQAYDRGGAWLNQETLVGMQIEYLDACRRHENIVALIPFALDRLGGANAFPALRAAWDEIGKRLHAPELSVVIPVAPLPTAISIEYPPGGITIHGTGPNKIITIDHVGGLPPGVKSVVRMNDLNMTAEYQERATGRVLAKTGVKRPVRLEP